jgi:Flp pilus assembly protein TadG
LRTRGEDGVALVEFALVFPVLMMLLLGMITGGFAYNQKLAITNGVREGSRYGATLPVSSSSCASGSGTLDCWLKQVADVTQSASEGELNSTVTALNICVAYVYPAGVSGSNDVTRSLTRTGAGDSFANAWCYDDGRPGGERRVQVTGSRQGKIEFLVATMTPTLTSQSVTRFEAAE